MPRTPTTFKPGHKGMGGRPKGSRNRSKDEQQGRDAERLAADIGAICDKLQAELAQPERQKQMTVRQLAQVQKAISTRSKAHLTRYEHDKLRLPNGAETTGFRIEFRPWPEGSRPQPVGRGESRVPNDL